MKRIFLFVVVVIPLLSGCAEAMHRYGPHPFGDDTTYNVIYAYSSPVALYDCISTKLQRNDYILETGWPDTKTSESYFVTRHNKEVARYDFDGTDMKVTGTEVAVLTPASGEKELFYNIMKQCGDETE